jgi:hypothetical protein
MNDPIADRQVKTLKVSLLVVLLLNELVMPEG